MAAQTAHRDLHTSFDDWVSVDAIRNDGDDEIVVSITHCRAALLEPAGILMSPADAGRLAVALYRVITDVDAKAVR